MNWERAWMLAAALLVIAAAICLWRNNLSGAFVTGALGACAWFLSYRAQIRAETVDEHEPSTGTESDSEEVSTGSGSDRVRDNDH
jgi:hypothetical protein